MKYATSHSLRTKPEWTRCWEEGIAQHSTNSVSTPVAAPEKVNAEIAGKLSPGLAISLGIGEKSFTFGVGVGLGLKIASVSSKINESVSLTKRQAIKTGLLSSWSVIYDKNQTPTNGQLVGEVYSSTIPIPGLPPKFKATGIKVYSNATMGENGKYISDNVWYSQEYLDKVQNLD